MNTRISQKIFLIFCLILLATPVFSEVLPAENSRLNYTTVYFEEDLTKGADEYELSLYTDSTLTQLFASKKAKLPAFWVADLDWAKTYYWRISALKKENGPAVPGKIHRFSIMKIVYQSYEGIRIDIIINKEEEHGGGVMCIDYTKSVIDRRGRQIWAIPPVDSVPLGKMYIRDMRITKENTITFLTFHVPYEIDFSGKVLWQAAYPFIMGKDTIIYHHDFKKTSRGTYMVMGDKVVYRKILGHYSDQEQKCNPDITTINGMLYKKTPITILLEFNKEGKLIWFWDANTYISDEDLNYKKVEGCTPNFATHANAFSENEEGTKVYVGFRDINRVVKIDKKTKQVESSYGERYPSGDATIQVEMLNQHDANVSNHNSIYVFNNNGFKNPHGVSSILELKDNIRNDEAAVIWRFDLNFDKLTRGKSVNGGNIVELPNKNLFFCAGALNRIFEITKDKKIVWDALLYAKPKNDTVWEPFVQYRANWAKQLNWYYFIPEINALTVIKGKQHVLNLTINNTGNAEDSYEIEVFSDKNQVLCKTTTDIIPANGFLEVKMDYRSPRGRKTHVLIKSRHSDLRKVLTN